MILPQSPLPVPALSSNQPTLKAVPIPWEEFEMGVCLSAVEKRALRKQEKAKQSTFLGNEYKDGVKIIPGIGQEKRGEEDILKEYGITHDNLLNDLPF